jgi:hypothetical protein
MTGQQVREHVAEHVRQGGKNLTIKSEDQQGHKYEVHVIPMPELSSGQINGTASVSIDGKHVVDKTLDQIVGMYDHMKSVSLRK